MTISHLLPLAVAAFGLGFIGFVLVAFPISGTKTEGDSRGRLGHFLCGLGYLAAVIWLGERGGNGSGVVMVDPASALVTTGLMVWLFGLNLAGFPGNPVYEAGLTLGAVVMLGLAWIIGSEGIPVGLRLPDLWFAGFYVFSLLGLAALGMAAWPGYLFCAGRLTESHPEESPPDSVATGFHWDKAACLITVILAPLLGSALFLSVWWRLETTQVLSIRQRALFLLLGALIAGASLLFVLGLGLFRGAAGASGRRWLPSPDELLTTNNRAIALGFFLFSAGILIFGMEWTEQGWGACVPRWGVTGRPAVIFLFYAILAHLRWGEERNLSPGAILSVFGGGMALLLCASIGAEWLP